MDGPRSVSNAVVPCLRETGLRPTGKRARMLCTPWTRSNTARRGLCLCGSAYQRRSTVKHRLLVSTSTVENDDNHVFVLAVGYHRGLAHRPCDGGVREGVQALWQRGCTNEKMWAECTCFICYREKKVFSTLT